MSRYELLLVLNSTLAEEEVPAIVERVRDLVRERGGTAEPEETPSRRRLAYPIKKQREGTLVLTRFDLTPSRVAEIEAGLRLLDERILRTLLVRL